MKLFVKKWSNREEKIKGEERKNIDCIILIKVYITYIEMIVLFTGKHMGQWYVSRLLDIHL
jgi:hypothetical protein